jgi:hypothetical protein
MSAPAPLPMTRTAAIATDLLAGVAAGLAASLAMTLFQDAWSRLASPPTDAPSATDEAADDISQELAGRKAQPKGRKSLSNVLHYSTGAVLGGVYGAASGIVPALTYGRGTLFAAATWLTGDEIAVPALGLGPTPDKTDPKVHAFGFASHLIFGLTLDLVRRQLNGLISARR